MWTFQSYVRYQKVQRIIFQSLQSFVQRRFIVLPHRNIGFRLRRFPIPLGKRWKICILIRCFRSRKETIPIIQNDLINHQKYLWENNGRGEHNCLRCPRWHGQKPVRIRSYLGSIRTNLCAWTHAYWSWCKAFHHRGNLNRKRTYISWTKRKV